MHERNCRAAAPGVLAQDGGVQPVPLLLLPGSHVIARHHAAASRAARLDSGGCEGTVGRRGGHSCFAATIFGYLLWPRRLVGCTGGLLPVSAASDPVAGGSDGGVPAHTAAAVAPLWRRGPGHPVRLPASTAPQPSAIHGAWAAGGAACGSGGPDAPGHAGGTPRDPAAHEGATGGKAPLVDAHTCLSLPANPALSLATLLAILGGP